MDLDLAGLRSRPNLLAHGYSDSELRRLRKDGSLTTLRRGAYVATDDDRLRDPVARHALLVAAELPHIDATAVVSHASAAVLHGVPLWGVPLDRMHITRSRRTGGRRGEVVHVHAAPLDRAEVAEVGGLAVASPARTVVDLARTLRYEAGVAVADAALHHRIVTAAELADAVRRAAGWPGSPLARPDGVCDRRPAAGPDHPYTGVYVHAYVARPRRGRTDP